MDKRYEEALERAKMILCNLPEGSSSARDIETIFPELHESEDEKTRMELIEFHKDAIHTLELQERKENEWEIEKHKEFIAYLEKQKEREPIPALDRGDEIILKAICEELKDAPGWVERIEGWYSLAKDAQQQAEWSEGDERIRKNICRIVKEHMRHCAEAGIEIGDHREALQYLEKQKERQPALRLVGDGLFSDPNAHFELVGEQKPAEWTGYSGIVIDKTEYPELTDTELAILRVFTRVTGLSRFPITIIKETAQDFLAHLPAAWSEDEIVKWLKEHFYISSFDSTKIVSGFSSIGEAVDSLRNRLKSLRTQQNNNLRWRRANAGANLPESIILPYGEEPRFGKCAVKDSYYIPISELKELPKE